MQNIPFRRFEGFVKQLSLDEFRPLERGLFDLLFPSYQDDDHATVQRRRRRFAGPGFPRHRYYSIASDSLGDDDQTLTCELGAYRNWADCGAFDIIDLARGCLLHLGGQQVELPPEQAIAILIRDPDVLPAKYHALPVQQFAALNGKSVLCYRFPYRVLPRGIDGVIDLRWPSAREWFFETFRHPPTEPDSDLLADAFQPTIAYSRFHSVPGRAPLPSSFWRMLPTLVNPDLGGGDPAATGSTLLWIAHWMWQHEVAALIYPSARCDAKAVLQNGSLQKSAGWNLVDYQGALPIHGGASAVAFTPNPWPWVALPKGVVVQVAPVGDLMGSFAISGMADYWARDYLQQTQALEIATHLHGRLTSPAEVNPEVHARCFWLGVLSLRWLRMALTRSPEPVVDQRLLELHGLALPLDLYRLTGRASELRDQLRSGRLPPATAVPEALGLAARISGALQDRYSHPVLAALAAFGTDLELLLLTSEALLQAGRRATKGELPDLVSRYGQQIPNWFDDGLARQLLAFLTDMPRLAAEAGPATKAALSRGESLIQWAHKSLRSPGK